MRYRYPYAIALMVMVLFGALDMLRGVAAPLMQKDWSLTYLQLSNIFVSNSLGYLCGSFLSGWSIRRLGTRGTIFTGGVGLALGLALTVVLHSYPGLLLAFAVAGASSGWQEIGVNHVVPELALDNSLQSKYFNWLHGLYGTGAFMFPAIAGLLIHRTHAWRFPYVILLAYLVVILVLSAARWTGKTGVAQKELRKAPGRTDRKLPLKNPGHDNKDHRVFLASPLLIALLLCISFYVMGEIGVGSWLTTYLVGVRGLSINMGSYVLSAFYFTFTLGRLTAHLWVYRLGDEKSVFVSVSVAGVLFATALLSRHLPTISLLVFALSGTGFAVIFPTITAIASRQFPEDSGKVLGFLFTGSGVGSFFANWLIGFVSGTFGLNAGLWLVVAFLGVVFLTIAWIRRLAKLSSVL